MLIRDRRLMLNVLLLAALMLTWLVGAGPEAQAAQETSVRVRVGVTADGIVQIAPADLAAAGVDPTSVDPRTFAMSSLGQPVAIALTGDADGHFDDGDRIEFFGQQFRGTHFQEKYTGERVYWLEIGGAAGPRIASVDATPRGDLTPPQDVAATVHARKPLIQWNLHTLNWVDITQETWFWARLQPTAMAAAGAALSYEAPVPMAPVPTAMGTISYEALTSMAAVPTVTGAMSYEAPDPMATLAAATAALSYEVPDPAPGMSATFRMQALPRYSSSAQPEHRTTIAFNGLPLLDQTWSGSQVMLFTAVIAPGVLVDGLNTAQVGAQAMPGNYTDDVYFPFWEVDYRRQFRAHQNRFDFRAEATGTHEYAVDGWASDETVIWDVTYANRPRLLTGVAAEPGASGLRLRFRVEDAAGARYWLQSANSMSLPTSIRLRPPTGLRNPIGGADSVIITPATFRPAAERLATWHRDHGRRAVVADLQDVYDEFNEGTAIAPEAIPNMLKWATQNWPAPAPAYLTLVGDGHLNMRGFNPAVYGTLPSFIPPYLAFIDQFVGQVPTDERFGDFNNDGYAEVAVGRLAVNSLAEADAVVDKIRNYNETSRGEGWQQRVLFVADNADDGGDFAALSDEIIAGYLPGDLSAKRAYLPPKPASTEQIAATRAIISDTIQSGLFMVQYTGHGNVQVWAGESLLTSTQIPGFKNGPRLPISMSFNCLDGYFVAPQASNQSIAELLQRQPGGGAIAVISPTGDGFSFEQQQMRRILMTIMFEENVREIGTALNLAKRRFGGPGGGMHTLVQTLTLFGDPALRLPAAASAQKKTYLPMVLR